MAYCRYLPRRWFRTSGLSRFGLLLDGISRWFAVVMAGGPSEDWVVTEAGVAGVVPARASLRFCFESDTVMVLALDVVRSPLSA